MRFSPILYELRPGVSTLVGEEHHQEQATPNASLEKGVDGWIDVNVSGPNVVPTASIFSLPYRMLFAVVTMDTVSIYDTQQAGPVCMLTKLHYDEFTDLTWCAL